MPLPAENLSPDSSDEAIQKAISDSISRCMEEGGKDQAQCVAMAHEMARRSTGRSLPQGGASRIRAGIERERA